MNRILMICLLTLYTGSALAQVSWNGGGANGGAMIIGQSSDVCDATMKGALRWDDTNTRFEFCDGSDWLQPVLTDGAGTPSVPPVGTGYFVLSANTYDGDMGGMSGANALCLSDLTASDWLGKVDAVSRGLLDSSHIQAFLCHSSHGYCHNASVSTTYTFAVAGDVTKGGATFVTNSSSQGPANNQAWSGTNYFNGSKAYWTGPRPDHAGGGTDTLWSTGPGCCSSTSHCDEWTNNTVGENGNTSISTAINQDRWDGSVASYSCDQQFHLLCMVHP